MDEPLSNLDAKLRVQLRAEIARVQQKIGVATIYVTHDQTEAMTLGHRVAVMRDGVVQQCDAPQELYDHPRNAFVAGFIGSPAMNLFEGQITEDVRHVMLGSQSIDLSSRVVELLPRLREYAGHDVVVGIRPEDLPAQTPNDMGEELVGDVRLVEALGSELLVHFKIDATPVSVGDSPENEGVPPMQEGSIESGDFIARISPRHPVRAGERISLSLDTSRLEFFDIESGDAIRG
jgi:multiple sugar transport system ATP-binding protein